MLEAALASSVVAFSGAPQPIEPSSPAPTWPIHLLKNPFLFQQAEVLASGQWLSLFLSQRVVLPDLTLFLWSGQPSCAASMPNSRLASFLAYLSNMMVAIRIGVGDLPESRMR